jgi:two-component system, response regulator PdtaR
VHALIIEDEMLVALILEDLLRDLGFSSFDWAPTQDDAVEAARRHPPDLITCDIRLQEGNGIEAMRRISEEHPTPTLFVTGNDAIIRHLPGAAVVPKPVTALGLRSAYLWAMHGH